MLSWPMWSDTRFFHTGLSPQLAFIRQNIFLLKKKDSIYSSSFMGPLWILWRFLFPHSSLIQCGRIRVLLWRQHCQIGSHWTWLAPCQILVSLGSRTDFSYLRTQCVSVWMTILCTRTTWYHDVIDNSVCDTVLHVGLMHPACSWLLTETTGTGVTHLEWQWACDAWSWKVPLLCLLGDT